jgi:rhodanese-related sulfurtransferase
MSVTLTKDTTEAVKFFEAKLAYEAGPVGLNQWITNKDKVQVIDLRTPELFAKGHVPTAVNVQYDELEAYLPKLNKEVNTVVYCYDITCHLSAKGALVLAQKGYRVQELVGGFNTYAEKGYTVEGSAEASSCSSTKNSCG